MPIDEKTPHTASRQHPVPQNVMDVEFKVVGDLTIRQLMYLFLGTIIVYTFYKSQLPPFWRTTFVILSSGLSIAVAFIPIQERGLDKWIVLFIRAMFMPSQAIWKKTYATPAYFLADYAEIIRNEIITLTPAKSRKELDNYLGQLPQTKTAMDQWETDRIKGIEVLFTKPYARKLPPIQLEKKTESLAEQPMEPMVPSEPSTVVTVIEPPQAQAQAQAQPTANTTTQKKKGKKASPVDHKKPPKVKKKDIVKDELQTKTAFLDTFQEEPLIDRPIIHLPSAMKGKIKIKTTTKLPTTIVLQDIKELKRQEENLQQKVDELLQVTIQVRKKHKAPKEKEKTSTSRISFFSDKYKQLKQEKEQINTQIEKHTSRVSEITKEEDKTVLASEIDNLKEKNTYLADQLKNIQRELYQLKTGKILNDGSTIAGKVFKQYGAGGKKKTAPPVKMVNVIQGTAKGKDGKLLEAAVVIIKDTEGNVIRALKANRLGQFKTQTSLPNGKYTVEVVKGGEKFDIISVEATGTLLKPLHIIAHE